MSVPHTRLFGRTVGSLATPLARLAEHDYPAGLVTNPHTHAHTYLTIVLAGSTVERFRGPRSATRVEQLAAFDVQVMTAGERHSNRYLAPTRCLHVTIDAMLPALAAAGAAPAPGPRRDPRAAVLGKLIWDEFRCADRAAPVAIEGLLHALLARPGSAARGAPAPPWLDRVVEALSDPRRDTPSLVELARLAGVDPAHLCRVFHRRMGRTIGQFVRERRIERACRLLRDSRATLAQVALDCGFSDQSHFTNAFRRATGVTPGRYRHLRTS
jgi:AraC family transcriptional regulator